MPKIFALIPAAGNGTRMGGQLPKQYLPLAGRPLIYHAIAALCRHPRIERVFVVLAPGDKYFSTYGWQPYEDRIIPLYCGGESRVASVFNGLVAASDEIDTPDDWILVHDAVRICLPQEALGRLIDEVYGEPAGGILAVPVVDTLKRGDQDNYILQTEPRDHLWQAQTPQMFRYRLLMESLRGANPATITDEAGAVERLGFRPKLVRGDVRNIKVTYPADLALAELILKSMG